MTFDEWWENHEIQKSKTAQPAVIKLMFREIAEESWNAAVIEMLKQESKGK